MNRFASASRWALLCAILGCAETPPAAKPAASPVAMPSLAVDNSGSIPSIDTPRPGAGTSAAIIPSVPEAVQSAKDNAVNPAKPPAVADAKGSKEGTPVDVKSINLKTVDIAGLLAFVKANQGKLVVADAWATWCPPCRKKFPKFVHLAESPAGKQAVFCSFANDEDDPAEVKKFLAEHKAPFPSFLINGTLEETQKKLEFEGVPHYLIFDQSGKIAFRSTEFEDVETKLAEMLKAP